MRKSKRKKLAKLRRAAPRNLKLPRDVLTSAVAAFRANREAKEFISSLPVKFDRTTKNLLRSGLAYGIWKEKIKVVLEDEVTNK
jgi:hypothetical protein